MKKKIKKPIEHGVAKVPVVMQLEAVECGAACLDMILAYYKKWVSLEQVREACGVSRDGSSADNVLKAARNYGFDADAYKAEPLELKENGSFPCIIHWNLDHFVVLRGFKGNKAYLNDPALGAYSVSMEEFDKSFTGIVMFVEPLKDFEPSGRQKSMLSFVKKRLKGNMKAMLFVAIITIILSLIGLITPAFSRVFMDYLLPGKDPTWFMPFVIGLAILCILEIVVSWIDAIYSLKLSGKIDAEGNTKYMWKVLHLPMNFFGQRMAGDIRVRQDASASIADTLIDTLAPLLINSVMLVFYLVVMIQNSWKLTIVGVASVLINVLISLILSKRRINFTRVQMRDEAKLSSTTTSGFELIETIKSNGAENAFFEKWSGYQASVYDQDYKYEKSNFVIELIPGFVATLTDIVVMVLGVYLIIQGQFTIGAVMAFQGFLAQFMGPAQSFIDSMQTIMEMRTDMERIDDVMDYPEDKVFSEEDKDEDSQKLSGNIQIKNLTFGYSKLAEPLIKDFNMEVDPGMHIALVGASGCGKSTISKLISGLYKPWEGEILFDGKPLNQINKDVFNASLTVVDQDVVIFEDSVSENIKMWDGSIEDFEMILAARDAHIHDDIVQRPEGYYGKMSEGGANFSGGQCQRLEIARVLAQDPTIIIMDEATSALDAKTEFEVVKSIKERGITCIVIAHRLSTIRDCEKIIVLDKGQIVGVGTHDELVKSNEYYKRLVTSD